LNSINILKGIPEPVSFIGRGVGIELDELHIFSYPKNSPFSLLKLDQQLF